MTTSLAVLGVNRRLSSLMQLLLHLFFITLISCTLAFSGGIESSQTDCSGIAEQGANFRGPLMSGEMQLNGQAATVLQHRQKTKYTYRRQLSEFNGTCTVLDISLVQGQEGTTGGIPTFGVEITNVCTGGCPLSDVHVACGDFASATLVNPTVFRRLSLNDCLVNNGNPISNGDMIRFEYDNSFMYHMHVRSAITCHWTSGV